MARRFGIVLAASLLFFAASCSDSGDDAAADTTEDETTTTEEEPSTTSEPDESGGAEPGTNPEYCAAVDDLDGLLASLEEGDYPGFAADVADGDEVIQRYVDVTPDDLKDDAELEMQAFRAWAERVGTVGVDDPEAETKVDAAFDEVFTPEARAASEATTGYLEEVCPS